ncbi:hypothetical protein JXQ70_13165 [bacterium]|nr:hypothetical protein [bacterium]
MKKHFRIGGICIIIVGLFICFSLQLGADENVSVTVTGTAPVSAGNVAKARTMALLSARSIAIEQGAGMLLSLTGMEKEKKVALQSQGKVLDYQIISEQEKSGIYSVTIKATVFFPGDFEKQKKPLEEYSHYRSHVVETEKGSIDWDNGFVVARGRSNPAKDALDEVKSRRVALLDAYANALELIEGLAISADTKVKDLSTDKQVLSGLEATIQGARIIAEQKDEVTGSFTIMVRVPFWGVTGIQRVLLPRVMESITAQPSSKKQNPEPLNSPGGQSANVEEVKAGDTPDQVKSEGYTGLIIDAGDTDAQPGLFPTVQSEDGQDVYSVAQADRETLEENGMVSYVEQPAAGASQTDADQGSETGRSNLKDRSPLLASLTTTGYLHYSGWLPWYLVGQFPSRTGNKPLVIKGISAQGSEKTEILISRQDADKIKNSPELQDSLNNCRVVVVLRSEAGGTEGRLHDRRGCDLFAVRL